MPHYFLHQYTVKLFIYEDLLKTDYPISLSARFVHVTNLSCHHLLLVIKFGKVELVFATTIGNVN